MSKNNSESECSYSSDESSLFGERYEEANSSGADDLLGSSCSFDSLFEERPSLYQDHAPEKDEQENWDEGCSGTEANPDSSQERFNDRGNFNDDSFGSSESSLPYESKFDASGDQESFQGFNQDWTPMEVEEVCYFSNGFEFFNFDEFVFYLECAMDTSPCRGSQEYVNWGSEETTADDEEQSSDAHVVNFGWQHMDAEEDYTDWPFMDVDDASVYQDRDPVIVNFDEHQTPSEPRRDGNVSNNVFSAGQSINRAQKRSRVESCNPNFEDVERATKYINTLNRYIYLI